MVLSLLAVAAAASYSGAVVWSTLNKYKLDQLYTYHPLAASAFLVFAVTGIVTAQSAQGKNHKARITYHGYWQVAATLTALATNTIIYLHKEAKGKDHLTSWHGKAGAATTGLWLVVQMFGGLSWYQPALITKLLPLNKAYIQHGVFGVLAFGALMTTHGLALAGSYQGFKKGTREWQILAGLLGVVAVSILLKSGRLVGRAQKAFLGGPKKKAQ